MKDTIETRVGFVALVGRPNAGKSTFVNTLLDEQVSAVSPRPQTTERTIRGIYTDDTTQVVFLDAPGLHIGEDTYHEYVNREAHRALQSADVIVRFVDVSRSRGDEDEMIDAMLAGVTTPIVWVASKSDLPRESEIPEGALLLSSATGVGLGALMARIREYLPVGPFLYDPEVYTDQEPSVRVAEILREKLFLLLREEVPYGVMVEVTDMDDTPDALRIGAYLYVEKESQKPILIGRAGETLRKIGTAARHDLEKIFGRHIFLALRVKILPKWRKDERVLKGRFGE